jgi:signal transduction histidine kinase
MRVHSSSMAQRITIAAASVTLLALSITALAQPGQLGTAQEARVMLDKAVAAVKADQAVALAMFNKGEGGFRDRDLYPFCFRIADGKGVATPLAVPAGTDLRTLKDPTGKAYGQETYAAAQKPEGQITEVNYMFPKPGTTAPAVAKESFVTKVGDLLCGVGYYK